MVQLEMQYWKIMGDNNNDGDDDDDDDDDNNIINININMPDVLKQQTH